jgi:hypothetical protein
MSARHPNISIFLLVAIFLMLQPKEAWCRYAKVRVHHGKSPVSQQAPRQVQPSPGDAYRNHIVEDGMTQDQLDRTPGR